MIVGAPEGASRFCAHGAQVTRTYRVHHVPQAVAKRATKLNFADVDRAAARGSGAVVSPETWAIRY